MSEKKSETLRVVGLPVRGHHPANARDRLESVLRVMLDPLRTHALGWPGSPPDEFRRVCACGDGSCQRLLDVQVEALTEALLQERMHPDRGIVARVGVGGGKTLISLLLPTILRCRRPGLLVPSKLREKTHRALPEIRRHWRVRSDLLVHTYEEVSTRPEMLSDLGVDLWVCDESHRLARISAGRTRRVVRFARMRPECRWVFLSGTFDKRGPRDSAHLVEMSLREGSYLPTNDGELGSWEQVLSSRGSPEASDWGTFRPLVDAWGEDLVRWDRSAADRTQLCREALERRVWSCPGVVTQHVMSCDASILIRRVTRPASAEVSGAIMSLEATKKIPGSGGVSVVSDQDMARVSDTLSLGFYYRWCWERTRAGKPDQVWIGARCVWSGELSDYLVPTGQGDRCGVDTPGHVAVLASQDSALLPRSLVEAWRRWDAVRGRYRIQYLDDVQTGGGDCEVVPVEPVWLTGEVIEWMAAEFGDPGTVVWYRHRAVAAALREAGMRVFVRGQVPPNDGVSCALSEYVHGEGHDLYSFGRGVIPCPPPNGAQIEQLIGRIHRPGQRRDEVQVDLWTHTERLAGAVRRAVEDARYLHATQGPQRLIVGTWI